MTSALEVCEWSAARPGCTLTPGKTRYPFYRRLGGPQGWSERAENLAPTRIRSPDRPALSQSLYQLSYPAHIHIRIIYIMWVNVAVKLATRLSVDLPIFGRCSVEIPTYWGNEYPNWETCNFLKTIHGNAAVEPQIRSRQLPSTSSPIHHSLIIQQFTSQSNSISHRHCRYINHE